MFRTEYEGTTLRDHLGLAPVPGRRDPNRAESAVRAEAAA